jgi:hypothetical protein
MSEVVANNYLRRSDAFRSSFPLLTMQPAIKRPEAEYISIWSAGIPSIRLSPNARGFRSARSSIQPARRSIAGRSWDGAFDHGRDGNRPSVAEDRDRIRKTVGRARTTRLHGADLAHESTASYRR